ncbi:MAG: polysaccharide biosynthesis C-terminal domain-containing protein, partial [Clostridia bacterium]|nr:polysaccharide biosynthesis C-terminal domain-containing protein [Clostridia bacterium]
NNAGGALYRVMGNSTMSMLISLGMNIINVIGNAILIYGYGMGSAGAAISTLVSRIIGTVITLYLLRNRKNTVYVDNYLDYRPDLPIIKEILRIGVPNGIESSMFQFGKLMTQSLISSMGTASIAANAVAATLANYQYMPGTAFTNTMVTVVGRCVGAEEKEQAKRYSRILISATYICLWAIVALTFFIAKPVIGFYELSAEGADIAYQLIIYHAICAAVIWPTAFTLPSAFRAASDVKFPLIVSMFSMWTFRVALSYVFSLDAVNVFGLFSFAGFGMGPLGVWVAMTVDWVFRAILFAWRYFSGKWLNVYKRLS